MSHGGAADVNLGDDSLQDNEEVEAGAMIMVATAAAPRGEIVVQFDKSLLDCTICTTPLKPPVFLVQKLKYRGSTGLIKEGVLLHTKKKKCPFSM
ncbi:hypothetical protein VPH35_097179 [Triticum aestivum]